jgi:hypothetical protein
VRSRREGRIHPELLLREKYGSRLATVDAQTGAIVREVDAAGQVTSAVPYRDTTVVAARAGLATVDDTGALHHIVDAADTPFRLSVDSQGGVGYEVRAADRTEIHRYTTGGDSQVATVPLDSVQVRQVAGRVFDW